MRKQSVHYLDRFIANHESSIKEEQVRTCVAARIRETRKERGLTQGQFAEQLKCSLSSANFWETKRALPSLDTLRNLRTAFGVDLNWLLRIARSVEDVTSRTANAARIQRIINRLNSIAGSIRLVMVSETRALVARAIYTASEHHEDAFFGLLESPGSHAFTGRTWVMGLEDGRTEELAMALRQALSLPERIKLARLRLGLTNHAMSTTLGIPQRTWLTWEAGGEPRLATLLQSMDGVDIDLNWLIASSSPRYEPFARDYDWEDMLV